MTTDALALVFAAIAVLALTFGIKRSYTLAKALTFRRALATGQVVLTPDDQQVLDIGRANGFPPAHEKIGSMTSRLAIDALVFLAALYLGQHPQLLAAWITGS
jgi:hypothetical protein